MALVCVAVLGCGDDGGGGGGTADAAPSGPDAKQFRDGQPTMTVMVTVSGTAEEIAASGSTPLAGVTIEAFRNADEATPLGMTTTDAQGNYSLTVATNGEAIDGFLKASKTGYKLTYLYPPYPLMMDFNMASVFMVTQDTFDTLHTVASAPMMEGKGVVALIVTDGAMPVGGATISSTPAATPTARYNAMVGNLTLPSSMATSTHTDGIGYLFNLPPGQVTVSAAKTGMTFSSHGVKAWADDLTTTVVVP